jgi:hypothetical protein
MGGYEPVAILIRGIVPQKTNNSIHENHFYPNLHY